jgi:very-long-chain (3R)-3-hydroxyacyl-CoA dehydratase
MAEVTNPYVYWAQDRSCVYLKVEVRNVEDANVNITSRAIEFFGVGDGTRGHGRYGFSLELYSDIDVENSIYETTKDYVDIRLYKTYIISPDTHFWPRLASHRNRPTWLRLDFDRVRDKFTAEEFSVPPVVKNHDHLNNGISPNVASSVPHENGEVRTQVIKLPGRKLKNFVDDGVTTTDSASTRSSVMVYLVLYNLVMSLAFTYLFGNIVYRWWTGSGVLHTRGIWSKVGLPWMFWQGVQWLEVLHTGCGYVTGSPLAPAMQHFSRSLVLFLLWLEKPLQDSALVFYLFLVWGGIEVVRYPYYVLATLKKNASLLTWLRYSLWIPLYPTGITIEALIIWRAVELFSGSKKYIWPLLGFPIKFHVALSCYVLLGLLPGGLYLINLMRNQRHKKLVAHGNAAVFSSGPCNFKTK